MPLEIVLRLTFNVSDPFIHIPDGATPIEMPLPSGETLTLMKHQTPHGDHVTRVTVSRSMTLDEVAVRALERWPELCRTFQGWFEALPEPQRREPRSPWGRMLNDEQAAILTAAGPLAEDSFKAVRVLRWRLGIAGPPRPITQVEYSWRVRDDFAWQPWPSGIYITTSITTIPDVDDEIRGDLQRLLVDGADEPVAHELLREAFQSAATGSQRSAVLMAVAAMEVAAKTYAARRDPATTWLMSSEWTPPLAKLLSNYLPMLPPVAEGGASLPAPGRPVMRTLQAAVELRNNAAHVGNRTLDAGKARSMVKAAKELWNTPPSTDPDPLIAPAAVEAVLHLAHDLVWAFDYWSGHAWAIHHISSAVSAHWIRK